MKVAVLAVYFGNLPSFVQLFLASCRKNESFDFFLIGDAWKAIGRDVPKNGHVQAIDLNEFKRMAEKHTGFKPAFSSPYKLCDYKPALGEIFKEVLSGYDYWGFCDIDIILGDMDSFLDDLDAYDVFSTCSNYLSGPLYFFRNTEKINGLYRQSCDVEMILESDQHFSFTECARVWGKLQDGQSILEVDTPIESMTEVLVKTVNAGRISVHFKTLALEPESRFRGTVNVSGRQVCMNGRSYIHYHHLHNKGRAGYTYPNWHWSQVPERYHITRFGVFSDHHSWQPIYRLSQISIHWKKRFARRVAGRGFGQRDDNAVKVT